MLGCRKASKNSKEKTPPAQRQGSGQVQVPGSGPSGIAKIAPTVPIVKIVPQASDAQDENFKLWDTHMSLGAVAMKIDGDTHHKIRLSIQFRTMLFVKALNTGETVKDQTIKSTCTAVRNFNRVITRKNMNKWQTVSKEVIEALEEVKIFRGLLAKKKVSNSMNIFNECVVKLAPLANHAGKYYLLNSPPRS